MSRATFCDGPECGKRMEGRYSEFVSVEAGEDADHGQFCSWWCLAAWATQRAIDREMVQP